MAGASGPSLSSLGRGDVGRQRARLTDGRSGETAEASGVVTIAASGLGREDEARICRRDAGAGSPVVTGFMTAAALWRAILNRSEPTSPLRDRRHGAWERRRHAVRGEGAPLT